MSALLEKIRADQVAARKARDTFKATVLTTLLGEASPSGKESVTDEQVTKVVQKFLKNLREVIGFTNDIEVQAKMQSEIFILEQYQPKQLSEQELRSFISTTIAELSDIEGPRKTGMVMKELTAKYKGQFDGKTASAIVKEMV